MRKGPYRIIVWGPGDLGKTNIVEILRRPDFELVGVRGYSEGNRGKDIGELIGAPPTGVVVTTEPKDIFRLDADVVLHTVREAPDHESIHEDVCRLLESGKNVISSVEYFPTMLDSALQARMEKACRTGQSSLHGAGVHPGFLSQMALMLSSVTMDVSAIKATEICDSDGGSTDLLKGFGFGERPQVLNGDAPAIRMLDRIYRPTAAHVADQLWGGVSRIERHIEPILAKERFVAKSLTCEPGTIAALKMRWDAYGTNQNCSTIEEVWYLRREDCPYDVKDPIEYRISIEGNPLGASFSFTVSATPGTAHNKHIGHLITSANMLQAIPRVCEAPPGLVFSELFSHAKSDLRDLHPASQFGIARPL